MAKREKQLQLAFPGTHGRKPRKKHGGEEHSKIRQRKEARPFDPTKYLHVTLRSSLAVREKSMLHPSRSRHIRSIVFRAAKRHSILLKQYVCVGNHLHFLIRTKATRMHQARPALRAFLREVAGLIARVVTGAKKGRPAERPFWDYLAWSRIVEWGKDLFGIQKYFQKNTQEFIYILAQYNWPSPDLPP